MKEPIWIITLALLLCGTIFAVVRNAPEDMAIVRVVDTNPGPRTETVTVVDPEGNYESNYIKVKLYPGSGLGIEEMTITGVTIDSDPNFLIVDNAVYDPNKNEPNQPYADLTGSFEISGRWKHGTYEIGVEPYDSYGNSDCKWIIINILDKKPPKMGN